VTSPRVPSYCKAVRRSGKCESSYSPASPPRWSALIRPFGPVQHPAHRQRPYLFSGLIWLQGVSMRPHGRRPGTANRLPAGFLDLWTEWLAGLPRKTKARHFFCAVHRRCRERNLNHSSSLRIWQAYPRSPDDCRNWARVATRRTLCLTSDRRYADLTVQWRAYPPGCTSMTRSRTPG